MTSRRKVLISFALASLPFTSLLLKKRQSEIETTEPEVNKDVVLTMRMHGVSLGDDNTIYSYLSMEDYNKGIVKDSITADSGEAVCFTGLQPGSVVDSTHGFYAWATVNEKTPDGKNLLASVISMRDFRHGA